MPILPSQYDATPSYALLREAEMGRIGFDRRLIQSLIHRPAESIAALVRFAKEFRGEQLLNLEDQVLDLFRHFRTPESIPFYLHLLQKSEDGVPDELVEAFADLGRHAVEPLLARYVELGVEDGADLAFILATLNVRDPRILGILLETLNRDVYEGALCLGLYGDKAARPEVEKALERAQGPAERRALQDCMGELDRSEGESQPEPFDVMAEYPERALPELDLLSHEECEAFLDCAIPEYRREAAFRFCGETYSGAILKKLLAGAKGDPDEGVRGACLEALGESLADKSVTAFLLETLKDENKPARERSAALIALAAEKRPEVEAGIAAFYRQPETRAQALNAVMRSSDARYAGLALESLGAEDPEVRKSAMGCAAALGLAEAAGQVRGLFDDRDCRNLALYTYALIAPSRNSARGIEQLYADIETLAGGLAVEEADLVGHALDQRLEQAGLPAMFFPDGEDIDEESSHGHHRGPGTVH